jgi:quercetin dioxygenase-like cupin family protein
MAFTKRRTTTWALFALANGFTLTVAAQDMVKVAPKETKVLIDNAQVRVVEVTIKPGQSLPMHSHPASVIYVVDGGKTKFTNADGKTGEMDGKPGDARWYEPVVHSNQNVGTTTTKVVVVELKPAH